MSRLIKTAEEIALIREGGHHLAMILQSIVALVRPGVTTDVLENCALKGIAAVGGRPAFLDYQAEKNSRAFPSALCVSVNQEIVHGPAVPSRMLKQGDIVTLDIGMEYPCKEGKSGYYTDMATTVPVGEISREAQHLLRGTEESLAAGIKIIKPGITLLELGTAIEAVLKKAKLGVVRDLVGHGVGLAVHEEPQVPNYAFRKGEFPDLKLEAGMVIAVEPMATLGDYHIAPAPDGFTYVTADGSLAAHFEHTILVTETGSEIMTT